MRSYDQFCGLAKALDVVGDRWTLLIVRELLLRGPSRYTDLQHGLPGIATNLLADRLRDLEAAGVVARQEPTPPVATALFTLTAWGEQLRPVVDALGSWAGRLMLNPAPNDHVRGHWLALPLALHLMDRTPGQPRVAIEVRSGEEPVTVETVGDGTVSARAGTAAQPDAVVTGAPELVIGLLVGRLSLAQARVRGLRYEGDPNILRRLQPRAEPAPSKVRRPTRRRSARSSG
jgi:DNA-binding HxlR family transcriptional regulator